MQLINHNYALRTIWKFYLLSRIVMVVKNLILNLHLFNFNYTMSYVNILNQLIHREVNSLNLKNFLFIYLN